MQIGDFVLRAHQERSLAEARQEIARLIKAGQPPRVLIASPCGSGKTVVSAAMMKSAFERERSSLFLAHGRQLIYQKSNTLTRAGLPHAVLMDGEEENWFQARATVASKDTYWARAFETERIAKLTPDLTIVDEAHMAMGQQWMQMLPRDKPVVGFTATPVLPNGKGLGGFYKSLVVAATYQELLMQRLIVPARVYAPWAIDTRGLSMQDGDWSWDAVAARAGKLTGDVVKTWKQLGENRPTACFASSVEHSIGLCREFNQHGIPAVHIDADTPQDERESAFAGIASGAVRVLCNFGVLTVGFDLPCLGCGLLAFSTGSLVKYLQVVGRMLRPFPGKHDACISEGQLVLTDHGEIPIEKVSCNDRLWDGEQWVSHRGAVYRGERNVITYAGLTATADHKVWSHSEHAWRNFGDCAAQQLPISQTGISGEEIRLSRGLFSGCPESGVRQRQAVCAYEMPDMSHEALDFTREPEGQSDAGLSQMQSASAISEMALESRGINARSLHESTLIELASLWWPWNPLQVFICGCRLPMDHGQPWDEAESPTRPNQKRWALSAREPALVYATTEYGTHEAFEKFCEIAQVQTALSACQVCGCNTAWNVLQGTSAARNNQSLAASVVQTKRRVWDILDAGPLHRFTVSGLLVHNCIIDHGDNVRRHQWPTEDHEWSLDQEEEIAVREQAIREKKGLREPICCAQCGAMRQGGPKCPNCGCQKKRWGIKVRTEAGELVEVKPHQVKKRKQTDDRQKLWMSCLATAAHRNGNILMARAIFRSRTKEWPDGTLSPMPERYRWEAKVCDLYPGFRKGRS